MQPQDQELERRRSLGTIELYSHGLKVTAKDPRVAVACRRALNGWCTHVPVKTKNERGEIVVHNELQHMYGAYIQETGEFWFHKGQIRDLQLELRTFELQFDDLIFVKVETYDPRPMKLKLREGRVLRDYQEEAKQFALEQLAETDFFSKLIAMPVGTGKPLSRDTPVMTTDGPVDIGELLEGDVVIAPDGTPTEVVGVYDQGVRPLLKMSFANGGTVRAEPTHPWKVRIDNEWFVLTTKDIQDRIEADAVCVEFPTYSEEQDAGTTKITKITDDGFGDCACISVEHPDQLFVLANGIVTHNTVTLCGTAAENGQRLVVGVLPKYGKKWCADIVANLDLKPKDVMLIEKTNQLRGVIDVCKTQGVKKLPPVLIITLTTMRSFLEKYEESPSACVEDMGCTPTELWKILDCGIFAIDEAHEHLHTVFKTSMYLHGPKFLALSGTMRTEDDFQEKVQNTIFPRIKRFLKVKMEKYIDVEFISYSFWRDILPKIRYQVFGRSDYSHTTMEGSIMKRPEVLRDYIQMVDELLQWGYCRVKQKGEKAGIYVATVEMANKFVMYLTLRHPELNIIRYCAGEGDSYDELMKCDVYVSTIQSAGTALDIPNLTDVICTTMVNSSKSNIQVLGRLRKLPNDRKVTMYMPFCRQIQKHVKYTQFRAEIFRDITKSIRTFNFDRFLGRS